MSSNLLMFILIFLLLFVTVIVLISASRKEVPVNRSFILKELNKLNANSKSSNFTVLKSTLIDSDKLLDYTFKQKRLKGETMGERLKNAQKFYTKDFYNKIWQAHKTRNSLVHEMNFSISENSLKMHISNLSKAIKELI